MFIKTKRVLPDSTTDFILNTEQITWAQPNGAHHVSVRTTEGFEVELEVAFEELWKALSKE